MEMSLVLDWIAPWALVWILCLLSLKASGGCTKILYCGLELQKRTKSEEREPVD